MWAAGRWADATQKELGRDVIAEIAGECGVSAKRLTQESQQIAPTELSKYDAVRRYHDYMLVMTPTAAEQVFVALRFAAEAEEALALNVRSPNFSGTIGKLGRAAEASASVQELRRIKPDFESRVREFLPRTATPPEIWDDFVDGLRKAGAQIEP